MFCLNCTYKYLNYHYIIHFSSGNVTLLIFRQCCGKSLKTFLYCSRTLEFEQDCFHLNVAENTFLSCNGQSILRSILSLINVIVLFSIVLFLCRLKSSTTLFFSFFSFYTPMPANWHSRDNLALTSSLVQGDTTI